MIYDVSDFFPLFFGVVMVVVGELFISSLFFSGFGNISLPQSPFRENLVDSRTPHIV